MTINQVFRSKGRIVVGLHIYSNADCTMDYWSYIVLRLGRGREVQIVKQATFDTTFTMEHFSMQKISKSFPIVMTLTGSGVLLEGYTGKEPDVSNLLMGLSENEVLLKQYEVQSAQYYAALHRQKLDKYLNDFYQAGYFVWDVELSSIHATSVLPLLRAEVDAIQYMDMCIDLPEGSIQLADDENAENTLLRLKQKCLVGNEVCQLVHLPALGAALRFFSRTDESEVHLLNEIRKEYMARRLSLRLIYCSLTCVFVALLINVFLFQHYHSAFSQIQANSKLLEQGEAQLRVLQQNMKQKEKTLNQVVPTHGIPLSYIADQFATAMPKQSSLTLLSIAPIEGKVRDGKSILFKQGCIHAEGTCAFPEDFAHLMHALSGMSWVLEIGRKEFKHAPENGVFTIEVAYGN